MTCRAGDSVDTKKLILRTRPSNRMYRCCEISHIRPITGVVPLELGRICLVAVDHSPLSRLVDPERSSDAGDRTVRRLERLPEYRIWSKSLPKFKPMIDTHLESSAMCLPNWPVEETSRGSGFLAQRNVSREYLSSSA